MCSMCENKKKVLGDIIKVIQTLKNALTKVVRSNCGGIYAKKFRKNHN